ncbi:MAG TPA: undecaprenyl-diphosphatase UppP [Anaerolineae bacterium]|nr:undecaprenyl-diphosphatase UppP [Anaerolineae bacterium]
MNILEAIFLGFIQGATEFLPISSSGHLLVIPTILGLNTPNSILIAITHQGTLLAVLLYFWRDLFDIAQATLTALFQRQPFATPSARLGWFIAVGSIPAAVAGLGFNDWFDAMFERPSAAAFFLLGTAALLVIGERLLNTTKTIDDMTWPDAIIIGLAQMMALLPGISRSGSTITAALGRGYDRATAARYSFLLGVPAILGAGLLALLDLAEAPNLSQQIPALTASFITSAIVGYACIHWLLQWLRQHSLYPFAIYCTALSLFYWLTQLF